MVFVANSISKIIQPLREGRIMEFDFNMTDKKMIVEMKPKMVKRLVGILKHEKVEYDINTVQKIVDTYFPNVRRMLSMMQKYSQMNGIIDDNILGAKQKGLEALELSNKIGSPELIEKSASILRQVAQKQKDWLNAFEMHMLEIEMRDSLNNLSALKTSANLQAKYEYEKSKEIDDIQYEKNLAL